MAKHKEEKTNVMRVLDQKKIPYTAHTYDPESGIDGVSVQTAGMVNFSVTDEGHLLCTYTGNEAPDYYINDAGHLCLNI